MGHSKATLLLWWLQQRLLSPAKLVSDRTFNQQMSYIKLILKLEAELLCLTEEDDRQRQDK